MGDTREDETAEDLAKQKAQERVIVWTQELLNTQVNETKLRSLMANIHPVGSTTEVLFMLAKMHDIVGDPQGAERLRGFAKDFAPYEASTWKISK